MSTVAPLVDERGEDQWTLFEAVRAQFKRDRRTGSLTLQVFYKHGVEAKTFLTPLQVAHMTGEDGEP